MSCSNCVIYTYVVLTNTLHVHVHSTVIHGNTFSTLAYTCTFTCYQVYVYIHLDLFPNNCPKSLGG